MHTGPGAFGQSVGRPDNSTVLIESRRVRTLGPTRPASVSTAPATSVSSRATS